MVRSRKRKKVEEWHWPQQRVQIELDVEALFWESLQHCLLQRRALHDVCGQGSRLANECTGAPVAAKLKLRQRGIGPTNQPRRQREGEVVVAPPEAAQLVVARAWQSQSGALWSLAVDHAIGQHEQVQLRTDNGHPRRLQRGEEVVVECRLALGSTISVHASCRQHQRSRVEHHAHANVCKRQRLGTQCACVTPGPRQREVARLRRRRSAVQAWHAPLILLKQMHQLDGRSVGCRQPRRRYHRIVRRAFRSHGGGERRVGHGARRFWLFITKATPRYEE